MRSTVLEEYAYDPWGRRRNPATWKPLSGTAATARGFTGHEHIDLFELVNMDGRVYDPRLGRFLSPDPYVQDPTFSQSLNRYSYCVNNPLSLVDPSGYTWFSRLGDWLGSTGKKIVITCFVISTAIAVTVVTGGAGVPLIVGAMYAGMAAGMVGGAVSVALNGGSTYDYLSAITQGAVVGAFAGLAGGAAGLGTSILFNSMTGVSGGVLGGMISGGVGGFAGGFVGGVLAGQNLNEALRSGMYGAIGGALLGGILGGYQAYRNGKNVWWGNDLAYGRTRWSLINLDKPLVDISIDMPEVLQNGEFDCNYAVMESIEKYYGGSRTQRDFAALIGKNEGLSPGELGKAFAKAGFNTTPIEGNSTSVANDIANSLHSGKPTVLVYDKGTTSLPSGQYARVYHSTLITRIRIYPSGTFKVNLMNPTGDYLRINGDWDKIRFIFNVWK